MKAIVQDKYGSPDVLELRDIDRPTPKGNEVLIRVHAAGLHRGDWHVMTGLPYLIRVVVPDLGLRRPKVRVRGMDVAGRVEAVGGDVARFRPGDEVFGWCDGSFAEYACAPEDDLAPKPATLSLEQAAAVPISGFAALQALRDRGEVKRGQKVLIIGASGGVGFFAVQLAKPFGAEVTGVCSTTQVDLVRSIGAHHVIDYTRDDLANGTRDWDLILDTAGRRSLSQLRRALTPPRNAGHRRRVSIEPTRCPRHLKPSGSWQPAIPAESSSLPCERTNPAIGRDPLDVLAGEPVGGGPSAHCGQPLARRRSDDQGRNECSASAFKSCNPSVLAASRAAPQARSCRDEDVAFWPRRCLEPAAVGTTG